MQFTQLHSYCTVTQCNAVLYILRSDESVLTACSCVIRHPPPYTFHYVCGVGHSLMITYYHSVCTCVCTNSGLNDFDYDVSQSCRQWSGSVWAYQAILITLLTVYRTYILLTITVIICSYISMVLCVACWVY